MKHSKHPDNVEHNVQVVLIYLKYPTKQVIQPVMLLHELHPVIQILQIPASSIFGGVQIKHCNIFVVLQVWQNGVANEHSWQDVGEAIRPYPLSQS